MALKSGILVLLDITRVKFSLMRGNKCESRVSGAMRMVGESSVLEL